jgi:hypothetical protein
VWEATFTSRFRHEIMIQMEKVLKYDKKEIYKQISKIVFYFKSDNFIMKI